MRSYRWHKMVISSQLHVLTFITYEAKWVQSRSGRDVRRKMPAGRPTRDPVTALTELPR